MADTVKSEASQVDMDSYPLFKDFSAVKSSDENAFTIDQNDIEEIQNKVKSKSTQNDVKKIRINKPAKYHAAVCDICSVLLSGLKDYYSHVEGKKHKLVLKEILTKNAEYKQPTYEELCRRKQETSVQNNQNQKVEVSSSEEKSTTSLPAINKHICHLCNVICNSQQMWDDHINGKRHQTKLKLHNLMNSSTSEPTSDNNPTSSNYCDVCSLQFSTEAKLTEHLQQTRHQERVAEEEYCISEATSMNINIDDYKTAPIAEKQHLFIYECSTCSKKFKSKKHLIGHLKSVLHRRNRQNQPHIKNKSTTNNQISPSFRSPKRPYVKPRPPYQSQNFRQQPPLNQNLNQQMSNNIFGAFDPDNQYGMKRPIQSISNSNQYDGSYSKRTRTYNNNNDYNSQYAYSNQNNYDSTSNFSQNSTNNYENQYNPTQYSTGSYCDSYSTSNYTNPINYSSQQPPPSSDYQSSFPNYYSEYSAFYGDNTDQGNNLYYQQ
ncbi:unnamed protein product [Adineta steineri]|uniref:C2H2-type domain-containing protein n=1 Tax=Adineta steineri TaxID=433720 RepID=A0A818YQQ4_9BILA|nr:unnamed protein product [Adineta steineri]CAF3756208.1 unnamed protein product [Adineta steineri]